MPNATVKLKVVRKVPTGLTKISVDTIGIDKLFVQFTLYFRYTAGFRPYLFDYTFNACELMKQVKFVIHHPALNRIATGLREVYPAIYTGCPYNVS